MNHPLTPPEHEHSETVILAAQWLANQNEPPRPMVPELRKRFDLTIPEACEAAGLAQLFRVRRAAFA